ncbi:MAG: hypothetical protein HUN04_24050 [Desulfobacter sp.]|nr:MAG: hypothetical protein HUN04_24050 [Desulfobacter sp.]
MSYTRIIPTPTLPLEELKNRFLSALYRPRDLSGLFEEAASAASSSETDEKYLRQILTACRRFNRRDHKGYRQLQKLLRDRTRNTANRYTAADAWAAELDLTEWQMDEVFRQAITFQLTSGCSNYCRRCNEWALPGVRGHFSRDAVVKLLGELLARGNDDLALYGGSDPLDWTDPPHDLGHVLASIQNRLPDHRDGQVRFSILTKIPKGKQELAVQLVKQGIPLSVSLTDRNRGRIEKLEQTLGSKLSKQHATSDLLIPACLDEDFQTVKPSITDSYGTEISTDGAFIIIPAFTSALYPFGHKKIPITRDTRFFPVKKLGRPALLVDYFKPLEAKGPDGIFHLEGLLDVQVENILLDNGEYELTPPGMRSIKEYFEIFDDRARVQRKKMTLSVIRRLKKEFIRNGSFSGLPPGVRQAYLNKIAAHLDFTRKTKVAAARVSAAAYLLAAVREYLSVPTPKTEIIGHLTQREFKRVNTDQCSAETRPLSNLFSDPAQDAWQLFRYQALALVHGESSAAVDEFIATQPARYDPGNDRFIPQLDCTSS